MIKTNYHTHSQMCDGEGRLEDYVSYALFKQMKALGFSGHAPLPFPKDWAMNDEEVPHYLNKTNRLKEHYRDKIELYTGMEIDYIDDLYNPAHPKYDGLALDYRIGSIHMLPDPNTGIFHDIDGPVEVIEHLIKAVYGGSVESMVTEYYRRLQRMIEIGGFDILGHLDMIKKKNRELSLFSEQEAWYQNLILQVLDSIAKSELIVEVNTGGIARGYTDEPYPSPWILRLCCTRNIPVTLSSDAHTPSDIEYGFEDALHLIKEAGYTQLFALVESEWQKISLV